VNVRAALVPALVAVLLTGCAAGQEQDAASRPAPLRAPPSTRRRDAGPTAAAARRPRRAPAVRAHRGVSYAGGRGDRDLRREEVPVGEQVVLRISSDVAEEVHVHGYDLEARSPRAGRWTSR
jgi:hypothetical protein